jgi:hypothetical protein
VPEFAIEGRIFPTRGAGRQSGHPGLCDLRTSSDKIGDACCEWRFGERSARLCAEGFRFGQRPDQG